LAHHCVSQHDSAAWRIALPLLGGRHRLDLMTLATAGLLRKAISSRAASTDFELGLMPAVNVMKD
jgi:hypothetical protein